VITGGDNHLVDKLSRSQIFQDYEQAFSSTTGLPLALRPAEVWQPVQQGKAQENHFCALMVGGSRSCAACLEVQRRISDPSVAGPQTATCFAGFTDATVPVRIGNALVGFLQTGQVRLKKPTAKDYTRTAKLLTEWGLKVDLRKLEETYFHSRVLTSEQFNATVRLLSIFAQHLSIVSNQVLVQQENAEPLNILRAKQYIHEHQTNDLSLGEVARSVNTSTFYFCKMFKKATGLNFTDYLSRVRIEKAKNLLINPNLRISEIAYEVGFQSLTHFNRVFRKLVGQSPTDYRSHLPHL
jgi:AraC-like DNA-binding protein/ligand-binding sensor protein